MAAQIITDWKLHTGLQATWILCLSTLPPDSGTLIVNVCLLDYCQVSSVPHYCGFKEQEIPTICTVWIVIYWNWNVSINWITYRTTTGSAPTYFHSLLRIYIPSRSLRSASERRLVVPSQRGSKSLSRTFSFTVPGRWNDLPTPIRNAGSLSIFKQQLKTHLFQLYLTTWKKKIELSLFFKIFIFLFLSFPC